MRDLDQITGEIYPGIEISDDYAALIPGHKGFEAGEWGPSPPRHYIMPAGNSLSLISG